MVDEVVESNQLVEACKIYISIEIFLTQLEVLAYFTHHVTFPFLHLVEKSTQVQLLSTFPKLYNDLKEGKTNTLKDFVVDTDRTNTLTEEQILEVNVKGDWTFEPRNRKFILMNEKEISYHFKPKSKLNQFQGGFCVFYPIFPLIYDIFGHVWHPKSPI